MRQRLFVRQLIKLCVLAVLPALPAAAQEPRAPDEVDSSTSKKISSAVRSAFQRPLHPVIKGVAPSGGMGGGLEFDFPSRGRWQTSATGLVTARRYWSGQIRSQYLGRRTHVEGYARVRHMPQLNFFGLGSDSPARLQTNFRLRDSIAGAMATVRLTGWLDAGGRVEELWPDVGRGRSGVVPSIEQHFDERNAPGLAAQPRFGRYHSFVEATAPPGVGESLLQGGRYRVSYGIFDDQQLNRFTFRQLDVEGQQRFALFGPHRRLTLHLWGSATDTAAGQDVPFFLQGTLGSKGNLRSVNDDLIGSDGTRATLRGFRNYRFRGRNLLLLQAEYRVPVWGPIDATAFFDAGKVTSVRSELLNLSNLKHDYGFSVNVMRGSRTMARVDIGLGSGEGTRLLISLGGDVLP